MDSAGEIGDPLSGASVTASGLDYLPRGGQRTGRSIRIAVNDQTGGPLSCRTTSLSSLLFWGLGADATAWCLANWSRTLSILKSGASGYGWNPMILAAALYLAEVAHIN